MATATRAQRDARHNIDRLIDWYEKHGNTCVIMHTGMKREALAAALDMAPSNARDSEFHYRGRVLLPEK